MSYWLGFGAAARKATLGTAVALTACNSLSNPGVASGFGVSTSDSAVGPVLPADASSLGMSCHPGNVETFVAGSYRHAAPTGQGACVSTDGGADPIQAFYDACFGPQMSKAACDAFETANPTCEACIESVESASVYGPLILANGFVAANVAGCIEIEAPADFACAQAQQALSDCELAACAANCPVVDQPTLTAYEKCASEADQGGCMGYATAALCLNAQVEAGAATAVCSASSFETFYQTIVPIFCGEMSGDAAVGEASGATLDAAEQGDAGSELETAEASASHDVEAGTSALDGSM